jgi:signal transduction histidine kinase
VDPDSVLLGLAGEGVLIESAGKWYGSTVQFNQDTLPTDLLRQVSDGHIAQQRTNIAGEPQLAVGVPLPAANARYFEVASLGELERTLQILAGSLVAAATVTTVAGAAIGLYASRRALRPLRVVASAAVGIARGRLDTRLDSDGDSDLAPLVSSFNEMAEALEDRIAREARFTSDVSHELRTPLTAMSAAVSMVSARRDDLPERTRSAVDLLARQTEYFERLVLDLLEISRFDAGVAELSLERVDLGALVTQVVRVLAGDEVEVDVGPQPIAIRVDKRRLERVLANLLENASRYAGGPTRVGIERAGAWVRITVDDAGPGVPDAERRTIFQRFSRGTAPVRPGKPKGTGLGLSLVSEHVGLHGGRVWVEDAPERGARFVVELPAGGA